MFEAKPQCIIVATDYTLIGFLFGVLLVAGTSAVYFHLKGPKRARNAVLSLIALFVVGLCIAVKAFETQPGEDARQDAFLKSCFEACTRESDDLRLCGLYCDCVFGTLKKNYPPQELSELLAAVRNDEEGAQAKILASVNACLDPTRYEAS